MVPIAQRRRIARAARVARDLGGRHCSAVAERDALIRATYASGGVTMAELARYGMITRQRVAQVLREGDLS